MEKRTRRIGIVDCAGRVIIPKKYREALGFEDGTKVDFLLKDASLIIKKAVSTCSFCASTEELVEFDDRFICNECIKKIKNL